MGLVKFVAVGDKKNISDYYEYVENIMTDFNMHGYADEFLLDAVEEYSTIVFECINKGKFSIEVIFDFNTFGNVKQLMIDIMSRDYVLDVDNPYLEDLKLYITKTSHTNKVC